MGTVKTRLIPELGAQAAVELYERLLRHITEVLASGSLCPVEYWVSPAKNHDYFRHYESTGKGTLHTQTGSDLGERMFNAATQTLTAHQDNQVEAVIIIGTDCPALSLAYLDDALAALSSGKDAVVGPAEDGGYVLLGLRRSTWRLFEDIDWGTEKVCHQTRQRMASLNWQWSELPTLWDVDRPEDLARLSELSVE
jgi:rSAM/selenodomain-associated transferase 1